MKLSVVIPSFRDPLLHKTIDSLLSMSELGDGLEIIVVLDGYWPVTPIKQDPHVVVVHQPNQGMRGAINAGVRIARGEFLMRTDEHCLFGQGYDRILTDTCKRNWIVTAKRYFLDPVKWQVMPIPTVVYEKLIIQGGIKFSGHPWPEREEQRKAIPIDETMAMQGSMWVMPHRWWDKVIGELQSEGYGTHYQDSHEMIFKTWQAGGHMMVNKNTWFAHKHRSFPRTHGYGGQVARDGWTYSLNKWRGYYETVIKPQWKI
jgi:glycosyltransferase involved in cell wall biosynthesis